MIDYYIENNKIVLTVKGSDEVSDVEKLIEENFNVYKEKESIGSIPNSNQIQIKEGKK